MNRLIVALLAWNFGTLVQAGEWRDTLQIHGFIAQGFVYTSDNHWYGDSDTGSLEFREIGVNASLRPSPRLQLAAQLLSRTAGEMDDGSIGLDYGLLDWTALMQSSNRAGFLLGRIKNPLGFYNETRDVAFTRPGIFLPQSVYFDRVRDLMLSSDGIQAYGDWHLDDADVSFRLGLGYPLVDKNVEATFLGRDWQGDLDGERPLGIGQIMYEGKGGRYRLALSAAIGRLDFSRGPNDPPPPLMDSGHVDFYLLITSIQYNTEHWSLTGELYYQEVEWNNMGTIFPGRNPGLGYYIQGTYRLPYETEIFVRYGARYPDLDDREGLSREADTGVSAHNNFARDLAVGIRWDPTDNLMLRAELNFVDGTAWLSNLENNSRESDRYWNMFSLLASYRF